MRSCAIAYQLIHHPTSIERCVTKILVNAPKIVARDDHQQTLAASWVLPLGDVIGPMQWIVVEELWYT